MPCRAHPVVNEDSLGGSDGWSYEGDIISEPLRYTWRKDGLDIPFVGTPGLTLPSTSMMLTGAYSVVVSDLAGSVTSQIAILSLTPPLLRIQAWTNDGPAIRLSWTTPDHFPEFKDDVDGASWEWLPSGLGEAIVPITNTQQFYRLRMRMGGPTDIRLWLGRMDPNGSTRWLQGTEGSDHLQISDIILTAPAGK